MENIVSFGAGQNSTAMIILMKKKNIPINEIIFANVGDNNEEPETYIFIEEFKEWCKKNDLQFTTVKSHLGNLKDYYYKRKIIPYRMFRSCSDKFKVRPINKYIKENYKERVNIFMGIGIDERRRSYNFTETKTAFYNFPLIDYNIDRKGCIDIIKKEGINIPVKSGCYFCPFKSKKGWVELYHKHNNKFEEAILFEKNGRAYPEGNFMGNMTLETLKKIIIEQQDLTGFMEEDTKIETCIYCNN